MNTTQNDDDGPDLLKAELWADSSRGIYVPQDFAETVDRTWVTGVSDEDFKVLLAGPDHEHYWDAWADVIDNSTIQHPEHGKGYLYQNDGDLWFVKDEVTKIVLGHTFRPMVRSDFDGLAGADEGSFICDDCDGDVLLVLNPNGTISEISEDSQTDWTPSKIL